MAELTVRAKAGNAAAAYEIAAVAAQRGDLKPLRSFADAGNGWATFHLAQALADNGDIDELRARAEAGDTSAGDGLARLLAERNDLDDLRDWADASVDLLPERRLAAELVRRDLLDELRARANAGGSRSAEVLAQALRDQGKLRELRSRASGPICGA